LNLIDGIPSPPLHELAAEFEEIRRQTEVSPDRLKITE
jgi:hypothetical protein